MPEPDPKELLQQACGRDDAKEVRELLHRFPDLRDAINDPIAAFESPLIVQARSREMLDTLLAAGAEINARSKWWAGGFGLLDQAEPELAHYAITRGARLDAHSAARLGLLDNLRELIATDPARVHARGGDGQTPLHFASTIAVADFLLAQGADINARDVDHESTPAQYMIGDRAAIARHLVQRGSETDILLAAALGDRTLVERHLERDPDCIRTRVSDEYFPMIGGKSGGTIYQWTLGWYVSAHDVALKFGHRDLHAFLLQHSPPEVRFLVACWSGDDAAVRTQLKEDPDLPGRLTAVDRRQPAHAARNNNLPAVNTMLRAGLPVDGRSQHGATPLHWAAYHGNAEMVQAILAHRPAIHDRKNDFDGTPLGWALHGSQDGWHRKTGNYPAVVELLLKNGAELPDKLLGTEAVQEVLRCFGVR